MKMKLRYRLLMAMNEAGKQTHDEFESRSRLSPAQRHQNRPTQARWKSAAKATENSEDEIISVHVWRDDALLKTGKPVAARHGTATHGVFSLEKSPIATCRLHGLMQIDTRFSATNLNFQ